MGPAVLFLNFKGAIGPSVVLPADMFTVALMPTVTALEAHCVGLNQGVDYIAFCTQYPD